MDGPYSRVAAVTSRIRVAYDVLTRRRPIYYGWWMLAVSVLAVAATGGLSFWSLGLYVRPLEDDFGWSRAEVSLGFSLSFLASGLIAPLIGRWIDLRGPRQIILVGALLTAATYVLLATTNAIWQWYLYQSINAVCRQMMFFIPFQALISRWFSKRRGLAVGILGMGFALGGFAVVPFMRVIIDAVGWEGSFVVAGGVIAAIFIPMNLFLIRNTPDDVGQHLDGLRPRTLATPMAADPPAITARQALRTPLFWALTLGIGFFIAGLVAWIVHAVPFFESRGVSPGWAVGIVSITAGCSMFARIAFGLLADRITRIELMAVVLTVVLSVALVAMLVSATTGVIALFVVLWVVGSSGGPMFEPLLLTRAFGVAHFATILGVVVVVETVGQVLAPTVVGAIFDSTGSYDWALVLLIALFVIAGALFFVASRLPRPLDLGATPYGA